MPAAVRGGDPDMTQPAGGLHLEQGFEIRLPVDEVVDLQQVEAFDAPQPGGFRDLRGPAIRRGPDLVGREHRGGMSETAETVADHGLCGAVHRRTVDDTAAFLDKGGHDRRAPVAQFRIGAHIERDPAAEPDRGDGGGGPRACRSRGGHHPQCRGAGKQQGPPVRVHRRPRAGCDTGDGSSRCVGLQASQPVLPAGRPRALGASARPKKPASRMTVMP